MANVKELTKKLVVVEEEFMGSCFSMMNFKGLASMDTKEFEMMRAALTFMNTANELMVEYAKVIDDMNTKLDLIVKKMGIEP